MKSRMYSGTPGSNQETANGLGQAGPYQLYPGVNILYYIFPYCNIGQHIETYLLHL